MQVAVAGVIGVSALTNYALAQLDGLWSSPPKQKTLPSSSALYAAGTARRNQYLTGYGIEHPGFTTPQNPTRVAVGGSAFGPDGSGVFTIQQRDLPPRINTRKRAIEFLGEDSEQQYKRYSRRHIHLGKWRTYTRAVAFGARPSRKRRFAKS